MQLKALFATTQRDQMAVDRLAVVPREIDNLAANVLTGVLGATLVELPSNRESEKARLEAQLEGLTTSPATAVILPDPAPLLPF